MGRCINFVFQNISRFDVECRDRFCDVRRLFSLRPCPVLILTRPRWSAVVLATSLELQLSVGMARLVSQRVADAVRAFV